MKKKDVHFFVNKEKGVVVATIKNTSYDFIDFVANDIHKLGCPLTSLLFEKQQLDYLMPNRFVGIARLGEDDVWDEETGKLIAYDRAKIKRDNSFFKRANAFARDLEQQKEAIFDTIDAYGKKLSKNMVYRKQKIEKRIGNE